ncbi:LmeA family phospholipid-binding protein [Streptomyces sp. NPDC002343]
MTFSGRLVGLGFPRRTVVSLASVLVLVTLVGTAEVVTRGRIADRIATAAAKRLGTRPAVGLGATPVLWQLARGAFADVELTADDVAARHLTGLRVDAHLRQVRRSRKGGTVGSSTVTVDICSASLVAGASARALRRAWWCPIPRTDGWSCTSAVPVLWLSRSPRFWTA